MAISTEYDTAILSRIGKDYDTTTHTQLNYLSKTEVVYFRDSERVIEVLRIKYLDNQGNPFTALHDFNLRDDQSPYGQAYQDFYGGPLSTDYQQCRVRDASPRSQVWAAASDGNIYQFYTGGLDNTDLTNPTVGNAFNATAITLRYLGSERTAMKTLEWWGDPFINWYIYEGFLNVIVDPGTWTNLTMQARPFPGDEGNAHYQADLQRPEMIQCYMWAQLTSHPADAPNPATPMQLSNPPHIPLETYGRLYMASPILGDSRGR